MNMQVDIYFEVAYTDPLWQWDRLTMYRNGFVLFDDDYINFEFFQFKEGDNKMPKPIESWIKEIVQQEVGAIVRNGNLASKGFVKSCIMEEKMRAKKQNANCECVSPLFDDIKNKPVNGHWGDGETQGFKTKINNFINDTAKSHCRTPASIKAKMFRILQNSFKEV